MTDDNGAWLPDADVPTYFVPAPHDRTVVVFVRAGELDEPLPLAGITAVAVRAAIAGLPAGHAVRELGVDAALSTIVIRGDRAEISETINWLAAAMREPDEDRIVAELDRAKSDPDARAGNLRQLHHVTRFGCRGPGASEFPRLGAFKAVPDDVVAVAERAFVAGNVALLVMADEPWDLSFELAPGARLALPPAPRLEDARPPAQTTGPVEGASVSFELPASLPGRVALQLVATRLQALGAAGNVSASFEQISEGEGVGMVLAPVANSVVEEAGTAIVQEIAQLAATPPEPEELREVGAAWLADLGSPSAWGWFVVGEMLLRSRLDSRAELVDRLWDVEPAAVSLAAELMARTSLLLLPRGVLVEPELIPEAALREAPAPVEGKRLRAVGAAIDWAAYARGALIVGQRGVSQLVGRDAVGTIIFDEVELVVAYDDGSLSLVDRRSWLHVDPRLWRRGAFARSTILEHVPGDRVVHVPQGRHAVLAGEQAMLRRRRTARRGLETALAILVGTVATVAVLAWWADSRSAQRPEGGCAAVDRGRATQVECSSPEASARLLAIASPSDPGSRGECPPRTDDVVPMGDAVAEQGCLLRLAPPHPGELGGGGGILRVGDCIGDPSGGAPGRETPCGSPRAWATVSALAIDRAHCPPPAVDFVTRPASEPDPVLCLAEGRGIVTRGDCVTDPAVTELEKAPCGAPEAAYRVAARAPRECPRGAEPVVAARALPRAAVACLVGR